MPPQIRDVGAKKSPAALATGPLACGYWPGLLVEHSPECRPRTRSHRYIRGELQSAVGTTPIRRRAKNLANREKFHHSRR